MHFHNDKVLGRWVRANSAYTDQAAGAVRLSQEPTVIVIFLFQNLVFYAQSPRGHRAVPVWGSCDAPTTCLRATSYNLLYNSEYKKL